MTGEVVFWNVRRGWGFIIDVKGVKYFAHYTDVNTKGSYKLLLPKQRVEFDAVEAPRGLKASNIRPAD